ncbi:hypothetical protein O3P69_020664 [Scylla paramamosain]|uniref:Uncharacterized protein n=1 Tax=Scylla paramamosain TaxID=85552 RepID=A0AAW0TR75_SCYPA
MEGVREGSGVEGGGGRRRRVEEVFRVTKSDSNKLPEALVNPARCPAAPPPARPRMPTAVLRGQPVESTRREEETSGRHTHSLTFGRCTNNPTDTMPPPPPPPLRPRRKETISPVVPITTHSPATLTG